MSEANERTPNPVVTAGASGTEEAVARGGEVAPSSTDSEIQRGAGKARLRKRILDLLDELENASPYASVSLAEKVRKEASQLRSLRRIS